MLIDIRFTLTRVMRVGTREFNREGIDDERGKLLKENDVDQLPVLPLKDVIPPTSRSLGSKQKLEIFCKSFQIVLPALLKGSTNGFTTKKENFGSEYLL